MVKVEVVAVRIGGTRHAIYLSVRDFRCGIYIIIISGTVFGFDPTEPRKLL